MDIVVMEEGKPYLFAIKGRLDTNTSPQLEEFVGKLYEASVADIAVDMADCGFVSSAGLRVLVIMRKACSGGVTLSNPNEIIVDVLEQTGFAAVLTIA